MITADTSGHGANGTLHRAFAVHCSSPNCSIANGGCDPKVLCQLLNETVGSVIDADIRCGLCPEGLEGTGLFR